MNDESNAALRHENEPKYYRVVTETVIQRVYEVEAISEEAASATVENDIYDVTEGIFYHRNDAGEKCSFDGCDCVERLNPRISFMGSTARMRIVEPRPQSLFGE